MDRVCLLRKILTRLRGTNFCTSSARFARVQYGNQTVPNTPKYHKTHQNVNLGSNGVDRLRSLRKIPTRLRGTNFHTSSARFAPSSVRQPNGTKSTQIVRNAPTRQFSVQWGGSGAFVAKILTRLRGTNFCTSSARFAPCFVRQPIGPNAHK